jgi:hypothetical protein
MSETLGIGSRVRHPAFGDGAIIRIHKEAYDVCFMLYGIKQVGKTYDKWEIIEAVEPEAEVSFSAIEKSLIKVLRNFSDVSEDVPLGDRWNNGMLILRPNDDDLKEKEIPIETFFHKIVMVRDRLRVMEQRINTSKNLNDEEKVNLQQYITRIYGSLTTFNVLFKYKDDHFKGESSR